MTDYTAEDLTSYVLSLKACRYNTTRKFDGTFFIEFEHFIPKRCNTLEELKTCVLKVTNWKYGCGKGKKHGYIITDLLNDVDCHMVHGYIF